MCASEVQGQDEQRIFISYDASNGLADNSAQILLSTKAGRIMASTSTSSTVPGSSILTLKPAIPIRFRAMTVATAWLSTATVGCG